MRRILLLLALLWGAKAFGQSTQIATGPADPATCDPTVGQLFFNNATIPAVLKYCSATNTWSAVTGSAGSALFPWTTLGSTGTPSLTVNNGAANYFMSVTGNVTSVTTSGVAPNGTYLGIDFQEDGTGGHTIPLGSFPGNFIFPVGCTFTTTANANNWMAWTFDGTNWQPVPGSCSGSGVGLSAGGIGTVQASNGNFGFQVSNLVETSSLLTIGDDVRPKGPNPWADASEFGARGSVANATPNIPGVTATISGSPTATATISTNTCASQANTTCFVKGDAVTIFGAGAATGLSTPAAPTVTPANAVGATNSGLFVASPTASTSYQFCLSAVDTLQGQTACSAFTSISTGQATLGPQTQSVSSATLSNATMTVVTSSALPVSIGATCQVYGMGPATFNYQGPVATVSGTTLTFTTQNDTRNGASASAGTLGSVTCWNSVHIKGTLPAGGGADTRLAVYGGAGSATNFLGFTTMPGNQGSADLTYLVFDWYGATFSPVVQPYYVASTAPGAATKDSLETTITNVSGTTLTLAANSTTDVSGATILLDQAQNINTCLVNSANATCRLPVTNGGGNYVINTKLTIPNKGVLETQGSLTGGGLTLNDTILFNFTKSRLIGLPGSNQQGDGSFEQYSQPTINCLKAWPCMESFGMMYLDNFQFNVPDGGVGVFQGASSQFGSDWSKIYWSMGNGYSGIAYYCQANHNGGGVAGGTFRDMVFFGNQLGLGSMQTPAFLSDGCGSWTFPNTYFSGKGRFWRPPSPGITVDVEFSSYSQANYMPFDSFYNVDGGNINVNYYQHGAQSFDTTFAPMVATNNGITLSLLSDGAAPQGSGTVTTGNGPIYFQNGPTNGAGTGQNTNLVQGISGPSVADPVLGYATKGVVQQEADLGIGPLYSLHTREVPPAAPTCPVTAGGSVPTATVLYSYAYVYPDGGQGSPSNTCSATTSGGNQTVTVTAPVVAGVNYAFYRSSGGGATQVNQPGCNVNGQTSNVFVDTFSFTCANPKPTYPDSGPAGVRGSQAWSTTNKTLQYSDFVEIAAPANPATGVDRVYADSTTHRFGCLTNSGANCLFPYAINSYGTSHILSINEQAVEASASAITFTLPHAQTRAWDISNPTAGTITVTIDSGTLSGGASTGPVTLAANSSMRANCDGTNCNWLGGGGGGGGGSPGGILDALQYNAGGGSFGGVNSPTANGNYIVNYNVTAGAAVPPTITIPGVPQNVQTGTTYTYLYSDRGSRVTASNGSAQTYTLVNPSNAGFGFNYFNVLQNIGTAAVTDTASGFTIDGGTTLLVPPNWTRWLWSDGVNYFSHRAPDFKAFVNCTGAGNALQFTSATGAFSCGSSSSGVSAITGDGTLINNSGSTGAVTLTLANAGGHKYWGNNTGSSAAPSYVSLVSADMPATVVQTNAAATLGAFLYDFSASTIKIPTGAGFTAGASTMFGYDSTNKNCHVFANGADAICLAIAAAPTTGDVASYSVSSGTVLAVDSGVVAANLVTAASAATAAKQTCISSGASKTCTYIDHPERYYIPAANCNNVTAGAGWSIGSGGTVTCRAGTNNKGGYIAITDTSTTFAQFTLTIPEDWDTGTNPYVRFYFGYPGTDTGHTIIPAIQVSCSKGDGTTTDDVAFNASHSSSTTTTNATANQFWSNSNVQMNSTDVTGCVAGAIMTVQVGRATDTATSATNFYGVDITFPRLLTVGAE